jgi:hypothetical protein
MLRRIVVTAWLCGSLTVVAQEQQRREAPRAAPRATDTPGDARIEGQILNEAGLPLRRAHIVLRPLEAGITTIGAEADDKGTFSVQQIPAGRYRLTAEREGYLPSSTCWRGALRMPPVVTIGSGQSITNLSFRLRPWAVLGGRIKFDDGEPAVNARIDVYRELHSKGRHFYSLANGARSNDRGEYRIFGLEPGVYLIAVTHERAIPVANYTEQPRRDAEGRELPVYGYATTFYPSTTKLTEAVPVRLEYGSEQPVIDVFLKPVRKVKIRGRVTSGLSGRLVSSPGITVARLDAGKNGTLASAAAVRLGGAGFEIRDVTPGQYLLEVDASEGSTMLTRYRES